MAMKPKSRWVVLVGAAMCGAITASLNCYSIFQKPMMAEFGWSPQIVALAYTLAIVVIGFAGGPIGGWFQRKFAAHKIMLVSGIVFGIGWILTGFSTNPIMLLITFGIIGRLCRWHHLQHVAGVDDALVSGQEGPRQRHLSWPRWPCGRCGRPRLAT